jgi:hypothetical protein
MKPLYTSYAKAIDGVTFYFVKSYITFPEYKDVKPVIRTYGMHTNFERACHIAEIWDKEIQQQLLNELEKNTASSRVLPLYPSVAEIYSLRRKQIAFPSLLLKMIGLQ